MKQRLRDSHPGFEPQHEQAVLGGAEGAVNVPTAS